MSVVEQPTQYKSPQTLNNVIVSIATVVLFSHKAIHLMTSGPNSLEPNADIFFGFNVNSVDIERDEEK